MRFSHTVIESLGYALPDEVWTSEAIEKNLAEVYERLRLPAGRLELMTGIRERRFWAPGTRPSDASAEAGRVVLGKTGFAPDDIDLLIHSAVCRDRLEPATAAYVHGLLQLGPRCQILDVSNACLGFLNAMVLAAGLIEGKQIRSALIVSGENGRPLVENTLRQLKEPGLTRKTIKPFFANLTIGAGAVAATLCHRDHLREGRPEHAFLGAVAETDSSANQLCEGDTSGTSDLAMATDSEALLEAGVALARRNWNRFAAELDWTVDTPDRVITHQVGSAHRRALYDRLGLALDKDYATFPFLGNVGSVSLPLTLAHATEAGAVKTGDHLALLGIGSGLSSLMAAVRW
ncbi:MAG: 3-oxoacyl-ACP synthase III [Opitutales bacterium]